MKTGRDSCAVATPVASKKQKVKIEAKYTVGEYDILILSAEESSGLEDWLNENGHVVIERLWGKTAYDTAIDVVTTGSSIFSFNNSAVIITRGDYFTDALSGGSFAATIGTVPMVLVDTDSVPQPTKLWLQGAASQIGIAYILGGPGAVSQSVFGQVEGLVK